MTELTANLDDKCWSLRDFLELVAAAREARVPLSDVTDRLLDLASNP